MKLKEFINESKSPLSLFKKVNPMDKGGKVVPMAIMKKDYDNYFEDNELEEQPWTHVAANLLDVKNIGDLALIDSEEPNFSKAEAAIGDGWKTKKTYKRDFGYDEIAVGTIYGVDAVLVSDFGFWAYIIRNADKTKGKIVKEEKTTYKWDATQKKTLEKLWDKLERAEEYEGAQINRKVVEEAFQEGYEFGRKDAENSSPNGKWNDLSGGMR